MNLRGIPRGVTLTVLIGALVVLVAAFLVSGQAFLWVGLTVGVLVGGVISVLSRRGDDHETTSKR